MASPLQMYSKICPTESVMYQNGPENDLWQTIILAL